MKKSSVFEWHKLLAVEITNEDNAYHFLRNRGYCSLWIRPTRSNSQQNHYVEILKRLSEAVRRERPEIRPNDWILHHDNAAPHKALSVKLSVSRPKIYYW